MIDLYQDLLATLQGLDGNLHLNHACENQSQESYTIQQNRLLAARRLIEDAAAHAYALSVGAPSHARFKGVAQHVAIGQMRKDEICAMLAAELEGS